LKKARLVREFMSDTGGGMKKTYVLIALSWFAFACAAQTTNDNRASAQAAPDIQQMQGRMQDMQALMDRVHKTEDPQERQRLMREHMQLMQQGMMMMSQMMMRPQGGAPAQSQECAQGDTECRMQRMQGQQQMMGQRMGMMQMMMQQMMQREAEQSATQPADPEAHDTHR